MRLNYVNMRNELFLIFMIFLMTSVAAFQGTSSSYTLNSKLDFGAVNNATSLNYTNRFILGLGIIGGYISSTYTGSFGVLESLITSNAISINILITSPVNGAVYGVNSVNLNWSSDETLSWCAYSLDGGANNSSICDMTIKVSAFKNTSLGTLPYSVYTQDNYAYMTFQNNDSLIILNVTNKKNPVQIGYFSSGFIDGAYKVFVQNEYAYVVSTINNSLTIINVSNKVNPVKLGSFFNSSSISNPTSIFVKNNSAFIVSQDLNSMTILNITDKNNIIQTGYFSNSTSLSSASDIFVKDNYAYIVGLSDYMAILNITNLGNPTQVGAVRNNSLLYFGEGVYVQDNYAYVASLLRDTLAIIDITDKTNPVIVGNYTSSTNLDAPSELFVKDDYAYVVLSNNKNSMATLNISNKTNPILVDYFTDGVNMRQPSSISIEGDYAYVSSLFGDMVIIDLPFKARNITLSGLSSGSHNVTIFGNDSSGNIGQSDYVYFSVDATSPQITINSPINTTYPTPKVNFAISSNENLSSCIFTLDGGSNNYTMILGANLTVANYTNFSMLDGGYTARFICSDIYGNVNNSQRVVFGVNTSNSLIGYWNFDNVDGLIGSIAEDKSGNGNNGTIEGGNIEVISGVNRSNALNFKGASPSSGYVYIPYDESLNATDITISAWLTNNDSAADVYSYLRKIGEWHLRKSRWWDFFFETWDYEVQPYEWDFTSNQNKWHMHTITIDSTNLEAKFYIDGVQLGNTETLTGGIISTTGDLYLGMYSQEFTWNGSIDEVRLYKGILSDAEILNLFNTYNTSLDTDITPPNITITSPVNGSNYILGYVDLNWSSNEPLSWCDYELDGAKGDNVLCDKQLNWVSSYPDNSLIPDYFDVDGDYAYTMSYSLDNFTIVNVSGNNFQLLGSFKDTNICSSPEDLKYSNGLVYIPCSDTADIVIYNVSDKINPIYLSNFSDPNFVIAPFAVNIVGDYLYYLDDFFNIVNISDPVNLVHLSNFSNSSSLDWTVNLFVVGDYAYITSWNTHSLTILNISDKDNIVQVGYYSNSTSINGLNYQAFSLYVEGDYAYFTTYNSSYIDSFVVINVSDKSNPYQLSDVVDSPFVNYISSLYVAGDYAYVSSNGGNINFSIGLFDISDKTNPVFIGAFQNGSTTSSLFYGIQEIEIENNLVYTISDQAPSKSVSIFNTSLIMKNITLSNLANNSHVVKVRAKDLSDNYAESDSVYFTTGSPLTVVNISINSTDGSNRTLQDLHCSANLVNLYGDAMNVTVKWYKNSVEYLSLNYNNSYANNTFFVGDLNYLNTTKGQNWSCSIRLFSGIYYSFLTSSENLKISNTPPVVTLVSPSDASSTINRTPTFNWTGSDDDNDLLTYDFNMSLVASSLCTDPNQFVEDISGNYHVASSLNCFYDNGDYYIWSVRAKDDESTGNFADYFNISLSSYVSISLPVDSVNFGSVAYLGSDNTTDNSPNPFVIQNDGNSLVDVNISATDLWSTLSNPTEYFKLKIDNVSGEAGAFNWSGSYTEWRNVSTTNNTIFINKLNYLDAIDSAETDVYVRVPVNETPTTKSSIVTFISSFAE